MSKKTKFDMLVEQVLNVCEGRKPKVYQKYVMDFDKLRDDVARLGEENPFKKLYTHAIEKMLKFGSVEYTPEEISNDPKTMPEWEKYFQEAFLGGSLSKLERMRFAERFFQFAKDPDREYFSEYVGEVDNSKNISSIEEHIFNYVKQADDESATKEEIVSFVNRYGRDENDVSGILSKMLEDGSLSFDEETRRYRAEHEPTLDELDTESPDSDPVKSPEDFEIFRDEMDEDEEPDTRISPEDAKELGINIDDIFNDRDMLDSNY